MKATQIIIFMLCLQVSAMIFENVPLFSGGLGANTTFNKTSGQLEGVISGNMTGYNGSLIYRDESITNSSFSTTGMSGSGLLDVTIFVTMFFSYWNLAIHTINAIYYTFAGFETIMPGMEKVGLGIQIVADAVIAWGFLQFLMARGGKTIE